MPVLPLSPRPFCCQGSELPPSRCWAHLCVWAQCWGCGMTALIGKAESFAGHRLSPVPTLPVPMLLVPMLLVPTLPGPTLPATMVLHPHHLCPACAHIAGVHAADAHTAYTHVASCLVAHVHAAGTYVVATHTASAQIVPTCLVPALPLPPLLMAMLLTPTPLMPSCCSCCWCPHSWDQLRMSVLA